VLNTTNPTVQSSSPPYRPLAAPPVSLSSIHNTGVSLGKKLNDGVEIIFIYQDDSLFVSFVALLLRELS
jgi:hypothetical protein